jgi:hypothetical protein
MWDGVTRGMGDDITPDTLDSSGLLALQGGEAGPNLSPGINLSSSTVTSETSAGLPISTDVAAILGTSGSTANTVLMVGAGVVVLALVLFSTKGRRR